MMRDLILPLTNISDTSFGISEITCLITLICTSFFLIRFYKRYTWSTILCISSIFVIGLLYISLDSKIDEAILNNKIIVDSMMLGSYHIFHAIMFTLLILFMIDLHSKESQDAYKKMSSFINKAFSTTDSKASIGTMKIELTNVDVCLMKKWEKNLVTYINIIASTLFFFEVLLLILTITKHTY